MTVDSKNSYGRRLRPYRRRATGTGPKACCGQLRSARLDYSPGDSAASLEHRDARGAQGQADQCRGDDRPGLRRVITCSSSPSATTADGTPSCALASKPLASRSWVTAAVARCTAHPRFSHAASRHRAKRRRPPQGFVGPTPSRRGCESSAAFLPEPMAQAPARPGAVSHLVA